MVSTKQSINRRVYRSVFLGLAGVSVMLVIDAPFLATSRATKLIIADRTTYFYGVVLVTVVFNMPMNKCLDAMDPTSSLRRPMEPNMHQRGRAGTTCAPFLPPPRGLVAGWCAAVSHSLSVTRLGLWQRGGADGEWVRCSRWVA